MYSMCTSEKAATVIQAAAALLSELWLLYLKRLHTAHV